MSVEKVITALRSSRFRVANEAELQLAVERVLERAGVKFQREVLLEGVGRLDFYLPGRPRIGIELKMDGSATAVLRQLARYAAFDDIDELLLATTRSSHIIAMPYSLSGKPLHTVHLRTGAL